MAPIQVPECACHKAEDSGKNIQEEKARGSVGAFDPWTEVEKDHGVHAEMQDAEVQKYRHDKPPPFSGEDGEGLTRAKFVKNTTADPAEKVEATLLIVGGEDRNDEKQDVDNENQVGDRGFGRDEAAEGFSECGEGESEISAALVASCCRNSD